MQFATALYRLYIGDHAAEGQGLVEYALIIFLVSVGVIATLLLLGGGAFGLYTRISESLPFK